LNPELMIRAFADTNHKQRIVINEVEVGHKLHHYPEYECQPHNTARRVDEVRECRDDLIATIN